MTYTRGTHPSYDAQEMAFEDAERRYHRVNGKTLHDSCGEMVHVPSCASRVIDGETIHTCPHCDNEVVS